MTRSNVELLKQYIHNIHQTSDDFHTSNESDVSEFTIPYSGRYIIGSDRDQLNARIVTGFINSCEQAFERNTAWGHVTASAFILNRSRDQILLTNHAKLDRWLPLGGHCDGIKDPKFVALKEAYEESGLTHLRFMYDDVFDIDVHDIPGRDDMPGHKHLDARYLLEGDIAEPLRPTSESKALAWVRLDQLEAYTALQSVLVVKQKLVMP